MPSDPSSGPGAGLLASKQTTVSSAQLKALFTTPVAVTPTPRSTQVLVPVYWTAVAANSATFYDNPAASNMGLGYVPGDADVDLAALLGGLTSGDPSFLRARPASVDGNDLAGVAGTPLYMGMGTANLTSGNFPITFTLFYVIVPAS